VTETTQSALPKRFGDFEFDSRARQLRKHGHTIRLHGQPLEILGLLLERPGEVVLREELGAKLWPEDTFVDFEHSLNAAVNKLREALDDDASIPRFVETVPRRGYRFIARVEGAFPASAPDSANQDAPSVSQEAIDLMVEKPAAGVSGPSGARTPRRTIWLTAAAILLVASAGAYLLFQRSASRGSASLEIVPLTGARGTESDPAFSPDGNQVAFRLFDDRVGGRSGIYTTFIGGEKALQLTNDPNDCCPVWSPDGRSIGFARLGPQSSDFYALPTLGGTPRKLYSIENNYKEHIGKPPKFSWSPDGRYLALSTPMASAPASPPSRQAIALLSLSDSTIRALTSPPPELTDWSPAFSPDGKLIAFIRSSGPGLVDDLYIVPATSGEPKRLTFDKRDIGGAPSWTPDSREIVFPSSRGGLSALWRIAASGGVPRRVEGVGTSAFEPAVALKTQRLAYISAFEHVNLWIVPLRDAKHAAQAPQLLLATKGQTVLPYFAPDGRKIVFESSQSGYDEIWTVNSDGSNPAQLTLLNGMSGTPRWSYDGRFVAFDYRPADHSEIYLAEVSGGPPRILPTVRGADNTVPSWSRDGNWVYFSSNRGNESTQVWKVPYPAGDAAVQLTKNGGVGPVESADGFVYYARDLATDEIWKVPVAGGEETLVMKGTGLGRWCDWALSPGGIHFTKREGKRGLFFYEFATRKTFPLVSLEKIGFFPAVAPDGKSIVFSQVDQMDQTIMLVNHFR
jgi:Tol biopolymer transport system component/DNA-binding winged helix-turn-helix (wHTH) protein